MKTNSKTTLVLMVMTLATSLAQARNVDIKIVQCKPMAAINAETGELNSKLSPHDAVTQACADKSYVETARITSVRFDADSSHKLVLTVMAADTVHQIDDFVNDITVVFASPVAAKREKDLLESGRVGLIAFDPRNMNLETTDDRGRKISYVVSLNSGFPTVSAGQLIQSLKK